MIWLCQLTRLCVICLLLVEAVPALAADDSLSTRAVPAIDAEPLPQALATFASLTHLQLVYVSQLALGKTSHAVPPGQSAIVSLGQLLQGTGLEFTLLNDRTLKLYEQPRLVRALAPTPLPQPTVSSEHPVGAVPDDPISEVVVTATKRTQMLSSVPMSITVLTPDQLDSSGMQGISGIAAVTTGIEYDSSSQYGPGILTNIAIRGIDANKGDATTGIYVNDTPIQTGHTTFGNAYPVTFDLQQVVAPKAAPSGMSPTSQAPPPTASCIVLNSRARIMAAPISSWGPPWAVHWSMASSAPASACGIAMKAAM